MSDTGAMMIAGAILVAAVVYSYGPEACASGRARVRAAWQQRWRRRTLRATAAIAVLSLVGLLALGTYRFLEEREKDAERKRWADQREEILSFSEEEWAEMWPGDSAVSDVMNSRRERALRELSGTKRAREIRRKQRDPDDAARALADPDSAVDALRRELETR